MFQTINDGRLRARCGRRHGAGEVQTGQRGDHRSPYQLDGKQQISFLAGVGGASGPRPMVRSWSTARVMSTTAWR